MVETIPPASIDIQQIGLWVSAIVGLLVLIKIVKDVGKLEGKVETKLDHHKENQTALWDKVDKINEANFLPSTAHQQLCSDVTLDFNRQIGEVNTELKRLSPILTRLEVLVDRREHHHDDHRGETGG